MPSSRRHPRGLQSGDAAARHHDPPRPRRGRTSTSSASRPITGFWMQAMVLP